MKYNYEYHTNAILCGQKGKEGNGTSWVTYNGKMILVGKTKRERKFLKDAVKALNTWTFS